MESRPGLVGCSIMKVLLVHWNEAEAVERRERIEKLGHEVIVHATGGGEGLRELFDGGELSAIVIDLDRLPSHGREVGSFARRRKASRQVPLIFVGGAAEKVAKVKAQLPDATYTTWRGFASALKRGLAATPKDPVVPGTMAGYSGTPLVKKLHIRAGQRIGLLNAPKDFEATLGDLPDGVKLVRSARGELDTALLFVRSSRELGQRFEKSTAALADGGGLWIIWPKKSSGVESDLSGGVVRAFGLERGFVDHKICAVDETWSGLRFVRRSR